MPCVVLGILTKLRHGSVAPGCSMEMLPRCDILLTTSLVQHVIMPACTPCRLLCMKAMWQSTDHGSNPKEDDVWVPSMQACMTSRLK